MKPGKGRSVLNLKHSNSLPLQFSGNEASKPTPDTESPVQACPPWTYRHINHTVQVQAQAGAGPSVAACLSAQAGNDGGRAQARMHRDGREVRTQSSVGARLCGRENFGTILYILQKQLKTKT